MDSERCSADTDDTCGAYGPLTPIINFVFQNAPEPMVVILVGNFLSLIVFLCVVFCKMTPPPPKPPKGPRTLHPEQKGWYLYVHIHTTRIGSMHLDF